jgi:hypothetical protein
LILLSNISLNTGSSIQDSRLLNDNPIQEVIPETIPEAIPEVPEETPQPN